MNSNKYILYILLPFVLSIVGGLVTYLIVNQPVIIALVATVILSISFLSYTIIKRILNRRILGNMKIYPTFRSAERDICRAMSESREIKIVAIRGLHIFDDQKSVFSQIITQILMKKIRVRVLLQDPNSRAMHEYLNLTVPKANIPEYLENFKRVPRKLTEMKKSGINVELAYYKERPLWKLIATNSHIFFIGYIEDVRGYKLPIIRVKTGHNCFSTALNRFFDDLWRDSTNSP